MDYGGILLSKGQGFPENSTKKHLFRTSILQHNS